MTKTGYKKSCNLFLIYKHPLPLRHLKTELVAFGAGVHGWLMGAMALPAANIAKMVVMGILPSEFFGALYGQLFLIMAALADVRGHSLLRRAFLVAGGAIHSPVLVSVRQEFFLLRKAIIGIHKGT